MNKFNAAIVGCGRIASSFDDDKKLKNIHGWTSHARMYKNHPKTNLVAACDKNLITASRFKKKWKVKVYSKFQKMIKEKNIHILSICTPVYTHYNLIKEAIKNNIKIIFCEKPFSDSLQKSLELKKLIKKNNIIFAINHRRRWEKLYFNIKNIIKKKKIGKIIQVNCLYSGGLANTGTHLIDILLYLFGDIKFLNSSSVNNKKDPDANVYLKFKNNINCNLVPFSSKKLSFFEITIMGENGKIEIKNNGHNILISKKRKSSLYKNLDVYFLVKKISLNKHTNQFKEALDNMLRSFLKKEKVLAGVDEAYKSIEILHAILLSIKKNKSKVLIPVKNKKNIKIVSK